MRTRTTTVLGAAALLLALTACSTGTDHDDPAPAKPAGATKSQPAEAPAKDDGTAALEQSVRDYTAALFGGNGPAGYALVSKRCQTAMTAEQFASMAEQAQHDYGSQKATGIKVDQISGDLARVSYGAGRIPQFERKSQPWVREDGTWRWDACPSTG